MGLVTTGTGRARNPFVPENGIAGPAILKVQVESSGNDLEVSAGFSGFLVDN
jgi:hypothetical protein